MINVSWDSQKSPTHCCQPTRKRLIHVETREENHGLAGHHKTGLLQIKFLINAVNKELLLLVLVLMLLPERSCHKMTTWKFNAQLKLTAANCSRPTAFLLSERLPLWPCRGLWVLRKPQNETLPFATNWKMFAAIFCVFRLADNAHLMHSHESNHEPHFNCWLYNLFAPPLPPLQAAPSNI